MKKFLFWLKQLFDFSSVRLAVVRRYRDANGHYIGELYLERNGRYEMVGVSLDSLPLDSKGGRAWRLDTKHDFLAPIAKSTLRAGAIDPFANDATRRMIGALPRWNMTLQVHNRFIEHVLQGGKA